MEVWADWWQVQKWLDFNGTTLEKRSAYIMCAAEVSLPFWDHNGTFYAMGSVLNCRKPNSIFDVSVAGEQPISTKYLVYHRLIFLFTIQEMTMEECREALAISEWKQLHIKIYTVTQLGLTLLSILVLISP